MVTRYFDFEVRKHDFLKLFLVLLIPNMLRHLSYFFAYLQTGIYPSVSPESVAIFGAGQFALFFLEEVGLSLIMAVVYFFRHELHFLTLGYLVDPVIDAFNSLSVELFNYVPLTNFLMRELVLPYLFFGFILMFYYDHYEKVKDYVYALLLLILSLQVIF
ncbi:hypothetical protein COT72_01440 [archaeon CG10_big_fil_rev_8_21_14_0_10_43_11]|nr:MAG: hypothetical protein COT72_01440 [archaeon CG10_big_fil_rev_8_21_14_0_10_43_11]